MEISEKLIKPLIETRYLTMENADRYRSIIRLFYLNYEKLKYWMYQEEVYEELKKSEYFASYTMEQCQQDLTALAGWKNLYTIQDTRKVTTIEEFKNKKFRYQLSEYSVEIERMVLRLEKLFIEGASLEPTLLERIRITLGKMQEIGTQDDEHVYSWWKDLNQDFVRLNQNYQDYMRELNSVKAEEMMKTRAFLLFKDKLIDYLRSFVKSLQLNVGMIEQFLKKSESFGIQELLDRVAAYERSIPRLDAEISEDLIRANIRGRFESIRNWFLGENGSESEALKVFDTTNEIIRKITRYASQISDMSSGGANRREEYRKLAVMFGKTRDLKQAHCLAANVFGIERPLHLKGDFPRETDSINSGVFDEKAKCFTVTPRVRNYKEKTKRSGIVDRTKEKEAAREAELLRLKEEQKILNGYMKGNNLEFASLPELTPHVRDVFLTWLSKALERKDLRAKTEEGRAYFIEKPEDGAVCVLECTDGRFRMPAYRIVFEDE